MDELDKVLNRQRGFRYPAADRFDARKHVRLLRSTPGNGNRQHLYTLETVLLEHLRGIQYRALSYVWGHVHGVDDIREIRVDGQGFFIRRNLFEFLDIASATDEHGLFFIDAICIDQLNHRERQCQVREMAHIFRYADQIISWLGFPEPAQLANVRTLHALGTKAKDKNCPVWTASQWAGFRYLSYHRYWTRIWIVQEVLLASHVLVWCGTYKFPLSLFSTTAHTAPWRKIQIADDGRPATVVSASQRLRSPAETVVTHRLRQVQQPARDVLQQGTKIGTLEEMTRALRKPHTVIETFQDLTPDLLHDVMRKFGTLDCSDPRDKLYGLLGILDQRITATVQPDYTKGVDYAYYQALKIGYQELYREQGILSFPECCERLSGEYLGYYCDVRDAFRMANRESVLILQEVLAEIRSHTHFQDALADAVAYVPWQQQFVRRDAEVDVFPDFPKLLQHPEENDIEEEIDQDTDQEAEPLLFKSTPHKLRMVDGLGTIVTKLKMFRRRPAINHNGRDFG